MKKIMTTAAIAFIAAATTQAQVLWSEDFSVPTWVNDPDPVTPYPDGDLYTSDLNYGEWGRVNANSVSGNGSVMFLLGHENGSGRSGAGQEVRVCHQATCDRASLP